MKKYLLSFFLCFSLSAFALMKQERFVNPGQGNVAGASRSSRENKVTQIFKKVKSKATGIALKLVKSKSDIENAKLCIVYNLVENKGDPKSLCPILKGQAIPSYLAQACKGDDVLVGQAACDLLKSKEGKVCKSLCNGHDCKRPHVAWQCQFLAENASICSDKMSKCLGSIEKIQDYTFDMQYAHKDIWAAAKYLEAKGKVLKYIDYLNSEKAIKATSGKENVNIIYLGKVEEINDKGAVITDIIGESPMIGKSGIISIKKLEDQNLQNKLTVGSIVGFDVLMRSGDINNFAVIKMKPKKVRKFKPTAGDTPVELPRVDDESKKPMPRPLQRQGALRKQKRAVESDMPTDVIEANEDTESGIE